LLLEVSEQFGLECVNKFIFLFVKNATYWLLANISINIRVYVCEENNFH